MSFVPRLTSLSLLLACGLQAAPPEVVARLKADVAGLCAPEMMGRGNGQDGLDKAAAYAVKAFERIGLKAQIQAVPFGLPHRERLKASITEDGQSRELTTRELDLFEGEAALKLDNRRLLYIGHALSHPAHDDLAGLDLKGRVVIVDPPRGPSKALAGVPPEALDMRPILKSLGERGAALVLFTHGMPGQGSIGGFYYPTPYPVGILFKGALTGPGEAALKDAQKRLQEGSVASGELPATLSLDVLQKKVPRPLPNVIATLEGTDAALKAEHIVVGAHLDHMGATPDGKGGMRVLPGADDNASGCAGVLEIARQMKAQPPRRSTTFILFGGEEAGFLGSRHWISQPTVPLAQVKGMVNLDCIGRFQPGQQDLGLTGLGWSPEALAQAGKQAPKGLKVSTDRGSTPFASMSDHAPFAGARIPAVFFFTGIHSDLHRPTDTAEKLNLEAMGDIVLYAHQLARHQADGATPLAFTPRPSLGLRLAPEGAPVVKAVSPGGMAQALKLQPGDVLVKLAGQEIPTKAALDRLLDAHIPGQSVEVQWTRNGQAMQGTGQLAEMK